MKVYFKLLLTLSIGISIISCGEKKETDAMEKPIEATEASNSGLSSEELGKELFEGKGICATCHKADIKTVGPSIKDIAKIYKEKVASIAEFINDKGEPLVDPSQYEIMKANFVITKAMSAEERKALEIYMMSFE
ncbi:c-type cytochrome [Flavobacterium sp.]|jgi:cytochrome c|uniref:c-type cytochrome n=1 Tax=Flavobacterium sp. TaxID=239 RepID=UPI0037BE7E25